MRYESSEKIKQNQEEMTDLGLLAVIKQQGPGCLKAASLLLSRYEKAVHKRCYFYLGNQHDAEDATQEALFKAYRGILTFKGESSFKTWLYAIAGNQCKNVAAKRARLIMSEHLTSLIAIHECYSRFQDNFDENEQVRKAINHLPESAKEIISLRFYLDLPLEEIAGILGIGLSATKMRLYRAQEYFKNHYDKDVFAA